MHRDFYWQKRINITGLNRLIRKTGAGSMDKKQTKLNRRDISIMGYIYTELSHDLFL
jgi:hypothetical protein